MIRDRRFDMRHMYSQEMMMASTTRLRSCCSLRWRVRPWLIYLLVAIILVLPPVVADDDITTFRNRPPPPKAAPPLPPPQQWTARLTGVLCGAVAACVTARRVNSGTRFLTRVKGRLAIATAMVAAYLVGKYATEQLVARLLLPPDQAFSFPVNDYTPEKSQRGSSFQRNPSNIDILVQDVERQTSLKRILNIPDVKQLKRRIMFWQKEQPLQEMKPDIPSWSTVGKKEKKYEEDYGL